MLVCYQVAINLACLYTYDVPEDGYQYEELLTELLVCMCTCHGSIQYVDDTPDACDNLETYR